MSTETIVVACKLPNGLRAECVNASGELVFQTFNGNRLPLDDDGNVIPKHVLAGRGDGAYGLTRVPRDFWEQWAKENATYPPFAKGMIVAMDDEASATAVAIEMAGIKTGLEPASRDPKAMPRGVEPVA